jgi:hypothetical protein
MIVVPLPSYDPREHVRGIQYEDSAQYSVVFCEGGQYYTP